MPRARRRWEPRTKELWRRLRRAGYLEATSEEPDWALALALADELDEQWKVLPEHRQVAQVRLMIGQLQKIFLASHDSRLRGRIEVERPDAFSVGDDDDDEFFADVDDIDEYLASGRA